MALISRFLSSLQSKHTQRAYRTDLHRFSEIADVSFDADALAAVSEEHIQRVLRTMRKEGLSESTRRRRLSAIRRFYDWLVTKGVVDQNPTRSAAVQPQQGDADSDEPRFLSKRELETLIAQAGDAPNTGVRDRALVLTIVYASLRRAEVAALDVDDVRPLGRHWVLDLPTGGSSRGGFVKIPPAVADALQRLIDTYGDDNGPLWRSMSNRNRGQRMSPDALYKRVRTIGQAAGEEALDIETLRRSGLRLAFEAGARPQQIQSQARLRRLASATRYFDTEPDAARLQDTAGDHLSLDWER